MTMASSGPVNYKFYFMYNDKVKEVRRITVSEDVSTSFVYLQHKLEVIFPELQGKSLKIFWKDSEGDYVVIGSDEELMTALVLQAGMKKLYVAVKDDYTSDRFKDGSGDCNYEHKGVVCDECNGQVKGFRYKCLQCVNFDLCENCERKNLHSEHFMIRMVHAFDHETFETVCKSIYMLIGQNDRYKKKHGHDFVDTQSDDDSDHKRRSRRHKHRTHRSHKRCGSPQFTCKIGKSSEKEDSSSEKKQKNQFSVSYPACARSLVRNLLQNYDIFVNPSTIQLETNRSRGTNRSDEFPFNGERTPEILTSIYDFIVTLGSRSGYGKQSDEKKEDQKDNDTANEPSTSQKDNLDVNKQKVPGENKENDTQPSAPKISGDTQSNIGSEAKSDNFNNKPQETQEKLYPEVPSTPEIALALEQMISMGFSNDGNWLLKQLESANGDIIKVLEYFETVKK